MGAIYAGLVAFVGGAVAAGIVGRLIVLARSARNALLWRRGIPGIRDVGFPRELVGGCALLSGVTAAVAAIFVPWTSAAWIGALSPSALLSVTTMVTITQQLLTERLPLQDE